jgi:hypothetical protein
MLQAGRLDGSYRIRRDKHGSPLRASLFQAVKLDLRI